MNNETLIIEIKKHLSTDSKFWKKSGHYHGASPLRAGSDGNGFHVDFDNNRFYDHVEGFGGSLANLGLKLGIEGVSTFSPVKTDIPRDLAAYTAMRGLPKGYLSDKGWKDGFEYNRKCILIPTSGKTTDGAQLFQCRFLDADKPKYLPSGTVAKDDNDRALSPIYGLRDAITIAKEENIKYLVQTNGAISVELAQYYGIPAFAVIGGENIVDMRHVNTVLKHTDLPIAVIFDCDNAGESASERVAKLYGSKGLLVKLPGEYGTGFDVGDLCQLYENVTIEELNRLVAKSKADRPPRTIKEAGEVLIAQLKGERDFEGRIIPMPFERLHQFGGGAAFMEPGFLTGVIAASGGGKTMFWQSLVEWLIRQSRKWGVIVDAREFSPLTDYSRHLTRESGVPLTPADIAAHKVYRQIERESSVSDSDKLRGKLLSTKQWDAVLKYQQTQKYYSGLLEYADELPLISETLDYMYKRTLQLRKDGKCVDLLIFDYLTLYRISQEKLRQSGVNIYNAILNEIKEATRKAGVHSIVLLQTNKNPTKELESQNKMLGVSDIAYANENHFNFILSLNPLYGTVARIDSVGNAHPVMDNATGKPLKGRALLRDGSYAAIWKILKNSGGEMNKSIRVRANFARLKWDDSEWNEADLWLALNAGD